MKKVLLTCAAAGLLIAGSTASAAAVCPAPMFHPWYVGIGLKWNATLTEKYDAVVGQQPGNNFNQKLKNKLGWDIFGGYLVTPKFGTELGFVDYGKMTRTVTSNAAPALNTGKTESNGWLIYFDGMYYVPVCKYFKVFAKGGVDYINHKDTVYTWANNAWVQTASRKLHPVSANIGAGAQFDYNQFAARVSYTNYEEFVTRTANDNWYLPNLLNLDVLYHFG